MIFHIAKREYLSNLRRKTYLLMLFGFPLILFLFLLIQTSASAALLNKNSVFGVYDSGNLNLTFNHTFYSETEGISALNDGSIDILYVLPSDLNSKISIFVRKGDISRTLETDLFVKSFHSSLLQKSSINSIFEKNLDFDSFFVENGIKNKIDLTKIGLLASITFILIFALLMNSGLLLQSISEEKENRVLETLLSSVSTKDLFLGKLLGIFFLLITQLFIWSVIFFLLTNSFPIFDLLFPLLYFFGGYILFGSLLMTIGALASRSKEGQQISSLVILPAMFPLWFLNSILASPSGDISRFLSLFPLSAPLGMSIRMSLTEVPQTEILLGLAIFYISAFICFYFSWKIFDASILLGGKKLFKI